MPVSRTGAGGNHFLESLLWLQRFSVFLSTLGKRHTEFQDLEDLIQRHFLSHAPFDQYGLSLLKGGETFQIPIASLSLGIFPNTVSGAC